MADPEGGSRTFTDDIDVTVDAVADKPYDVSASVTVSGDGSSDTLTVVNEGGHSAAYHNTYGYYVMDDDGNPSSGGIIFADQQDSVGDTATITDLDQDKVGFFLLSDGDRMNNDLADGQSVSFQQDGNGDWQILDANGDALNGRDLLFSDENLNAGGFDYMKDVDIDNDGSLSNDGNQNWEDIPGGGDHDWNDANYTANWETGDEVTASVSVTATFADYSDGSEGHHVLVEVPDGWSAPNGATLVEGSNIDGVADGTYMKVDVDNADIASGSGTVTVSVDLVPADGALGDVALQVYAGAEEGNLSGDELTTANNLVYTGASTNADLGDDGVTSTVSFGDANLSEDGSASMTTQTDSSGDGSFGDLAGATTVDVGNLIDLTGVTGDDAVTRIEISAADLPDGATLSGATLDGDSYVLEGDALDDFINGDADLTVTLAQHTDADMSLTTAVTVSDPDGGSRTFTDDIDVTVDAVADKPWDVSATATVSGQDSSDTLTVVNEGGHSAAYHNTYGYYVMDDDGNPTSGGIIFADQHDSVGDTATITDLDQDKVGFFLLSDGDRMNNDLADGQSVTFAQDGNGDWRVLDANGDTLNGRELFFLRRNPERRRVRSSQGCRYRRRRRQCQRRQP